MYRLPRSASSWLGPKPISNLSSFVFSKLISLRNGEKINFSPAIILRKSWFLYSPEIVSVYSPFSLEKTFCNKSFFRNNDTSMLISTSSVSVFETSPAIVNGC